MTEGWYHVCTTPYTVLYTDQFENLQAHYENMPIQIYGKFHLQKTENFQIKNSDIFHISAQNIDCGYSLEPPQRTFFRGD